jgi:hypothetical protein
MYFKAYLQTQCLFALTSWENQKKSAKTSEKGGMGQNSPNILWEACGSLHETFDPS